MISIYPKKILINLATLFAILILAFLHVPHIGYAAENSSLSLSVTPTLFQMSASPGQTWKSSIKIINNNATPITVYPDVVNFAPQGEAGQGKFLPILDQSTATATLAGWIDIARDGVTIAPEKSFAIPFSVSVPQDVTPGGHFAAILIGTKPPKLEGVTQVGTSQIVTSLFFVRVAGDVIEDGNIRSFTTTHFVTETPQANFEVRFENKGNVLLQPQGDITITNMWGKERGTIPINHQTHFGNVLPNSIRKFEFSWKGEPSFSDIGRYKAIVTLAYGDDGRKFDTSTTYFYVLPIKAGLVVLFSILLFVLFAMWAIRLYIRRMLSLAGIESSLQYNRQSQRTYIREGDVRVEKRVSVSAPVERGVLDLKKQLQSAKEFKDKVSSLFAFVLQYRVFFLSVLFALFAIGAAGTFIIQANKAHRNYEVTINNAGSNVTLSSEDIIYDQTKEQSTNTSTSSAVQNTDQTFILHIVNSSDTPGAAALLQKQLEIKGYTIDQLSSDFGTSKKSTVVVYSSAVENDALQLSSLLGHALLSADPHEATSTPTITIYIGNDFNAR